MTYLEPLLKLGAIWLCLDAIIIATGWYLVTVIRPRFPGWWRREIVDDEPVVNWRDRQLIRQVNRAKRIITKPFLSDIKNNSYE